MDKRYIYYKITCGGDAGWRFSNSSEWHSIEGELLFDASIWTMKKIDWEFKQLYQRIKAEESGSSFSDKLDSGYKHIVPFINDNEGVYVSGDFKGMRFPGVNDDKRLIPHDLRDEVIEWEDKNGNHYNSDYDNPYKPY